MNYVGQLAETVYVTVKELYEGLNPATLSGGTDVLVVKQPDGSFLCSPFHVRFGKLGVLRSREKLVDIEINGEPVDLQMRLGDNGEAFFVQPLETNEEEVTGVHSQCTSSIPLETSNEILRDPLLDLIEDVQRETSDVSSPQKKRYRRKKTKKDKTVTAIPPNSSSDELDVVQSETFLEAKPAKELPSAFLSPDYKVSAQSKDSYLYLDVAHLEKESYYTADDAYTETQDSFVFSDVEPPWKDSLLGSFSSEYLTSLKSETELDIRSSDQNFMRTESHIQWSWGKLPQVMKGEKAELLRASHSNVATKPLLWEEPISQKASFHTLAEYQAVIQDAEGLSGSPSLLQSLASSQSSCPSDVTKFCLDSRKLPTAQGSLAQDHEENMAENTQEMHSSSGPVILVKAPTLQEDSDSSGQRKESKETQRNQHLGPSGIHLEDSSSQISTNATLYFSQSETGLEAKRGSEHSCSEINLLQAMGVEDTNTTNLSDAALEQENDVKLSLCGGLADNRDISAEKFIKYAISYQDLTDNPGILDDPDLVVKIGKKHYNWAIAAPMILSLQAFQKNLPKSTIDKLVKEKMPKKSGRWWFSWGQKDVTTEEYEVEEAASVSKKTSIQQEEKVDILSVEDDFSNLVSLNTLSPQPENDISSFKKSLRLSSDQLRDLNLREGANDVVFSVTTQYQGTCRCHANIYLWNWYDKVVISDIDGTITKSDALGHILPQLGKDWTHHGIIKLYHKIHLNGYKFLYCSARSIGIADLTRRYLQWVNERGCALPKGPLLLTPSGLFSTFHREVIKKKPEVFKITCLTDIRHLFLPHGDPFFAGFGNRASDIYAYLHVGIPTSRIFTVNPQGELTQELIKNHKTTYDRLGEIVELMFPPIKVGPSVKLVNPEFSQFCYWRDPFLTLSLTDLTNMD